MGAPRHLPRRPVPLQGAERTEPVPLRRLEPLRLAPDVHVVRHLAGEGLAPLATLVSTLVLTGSEPVLVDTASPAAAPTWLADTWSVVDPGDVRWVFLTHDDADHSGNLPAVLDACPRATLVTNAIAVERLGGSLGLPFHRMRWVNDGEVLPAGDRELLALRPPTYDSPATRGVLDLRSGTYWSADAFGTPVLSPVDDAAELAEAFFVDSFGAYHRALSPWHDLVDRQRWRAEVERVRRLAPSAVVSAHGPRLAGSRLDTALDLLARLPELGPLAPRHQAELDAILAALDPP